MTSVLLSFSCCVAWPRLCLALDDSQLWLPRDYHHHARLLYLAAVVAEHSQRCATVTAGTISQDHSQREHPVFKITCRGVDRHMAVFLVDGISLEILNLPPPLWKDVSQQR